MPLHVAPVLREREIAMEDAGIIKVLNSVAYTAVAAAEAAATRPTPHPVYGFFYFGGAKRTPRV